MGDEMHLMGDEMFKCSEQLLSKVHFRARSNASLMDTESNIT